MASGSSSTTSKPDKSSSSAAESKSAALPQPVRRVIQNFLLIWLDANIDETKEDFKNSLKHLRHIVVSITTFKDGKECCKFLDDIKKEKVFMIVSSALGRQVAPELQTMPQIELIYVFCGNKSYHEEWAKSIPKVKGVYTDIKPICEALEIDRQRCDRNMISISFNNLDPLFMYTQLLKEALLEIEDDDKTSIKDLAEYCREQDDIPEDQIKQIEREYHKHTPIWWYTAETFIYSTLNRGLRVMDVDIIMKLELNREQEHGTQKHFQVFRGQGLSLEDFAKMKKTKGGLMSFNNFLSTSRNRQISLENFAWPATKNPDLVGILFVMNIDTDICTKSQTPFAEVSQVSYYKDQEEEILFTTHTIFRIDRIERIDDKHNDRLWQVNLTLAGNQDDDFNKLTLSIREEVHLRARRSGWSQLAFIFLKLGEPAKAEILYNLLRPNATSDTDRADYNHKLGWAVTKSRDVTEFDFSIDPSPYICEQWWRVAVIPSAEARRGGETVTFRDALEQYTLSNKKIKEIVLKKLCHGWNLEELKKKLIALVRSTGYENSINVTYNRINYKIAARSSSTLSHFANSTLLFLSITLLLGVVVILIPTLVIVTKRSKHNHEDGISSVTTRNADDYQSNSDYYQSLTDVHDFSQTDNLRLDRLSSPRFHPINGKSIIYLRRQYHMPDLRGSTTTLHWLDLETNKNIQLTQPIWGKHDSQFYWINSNAILFLSNRASSGLNQIFQLTLPDNLLETTNTFIEPIQITNYSLSIGNLLVNRQATRLAFSCQVYANLSIEETFARQIAEKNSGRTFYQFDKLFIRHWDEYMTGLRHHPFLVSIERQSNGIFKFSSEPVDVLFNIDSDSPTKPFGDGKTQWSFSANGNSFAYTRQYDETSAVAWTTNLDIYTIDLSIPGQASVCITCENLATDTDPSYSPTDNNILIYRSQSKPGYESDQYKIKLYNGSNTKQTLLDNWDRSIQVVTWSPDGQSLFLELPEEARNVIYHLSNNQPLIRLISKGTSRDINVHPMNNQEFIFTHQSFVEPINIYFYSSDGSMRSLTDHNKALLAKVRLSPAVEAFSFAGARGDQVWGWHMPPSNGTGKRAPLAFLIHGGPQSSWDEAWGFGWNFQTYASQGYAVIGINFHGSDSYGQNFTDSIISEYGSLPYEDLQLGLTYALNKYPYIDSDRAVALGASYGGYMIYWIAGQPEMSRRFKTLIPHNGIFDTRFMGYSTEELFFTEHDAGGYTPWENPDAYERYNPLNHVANWTQPMLIILGAHDYRVPDTQGIGAFNALQRRGIESRLVYFPTENHWILNPLHSLAWYEEVESWMRKWIN
ncbi:unnamed protein product [Rotaria sp. Silwood1]|nr:unnamed protein product [Rotaria sp. Silwood1]